MHLIELKNIVKNYGELNILDNIDFSVDENVSYSITGKSGAGKSTLLHILSLLDGFTSGQVFLEGKEISLSAKKNDKKLSGLRNEKFGFVFQDNFLIPEYTASENIMLPALIHGTKKTEAMKKAEELLEMFDLSGRRDHLPSELSTGEKQRVSICRALINDPSVIFADEPTGSLDEENAAYVENLFLDVLKNRKKTLVLVTHNMDFAKRCDKVYRISCRKISRVN